MGGPVMPSFNGSLDKFKFKVDGLESKVKKGKVYADAFCGDVKRLIENKADDICQRILEVMVLLVLPDDEPNKD